MSPVKRDEVVIAKALDDGLICVFTDFEDAQGYVEAADVVDGLWGTFYRLNGEVLRPEMNEYGWIVRLVPTGSFDLAGLKSELVEYAGAQGLASDGSDPQAFVNEYWQGEWAARWPQWPRWLDRRIHGPGHHVCE